MTIALRDIRVSDLDAVLALNNRAGPGIVPIDRPRMQRLFECARYFRVAEFDGQLAGFLIALTPETDYDSPNFQWFQSHFPEFVYIDRVVVDGGFRRHGIGRVIYADVLSFAEVRQPLLTCEVFSDPRDDVSMLFFGTQGFREVGTQTLGNGRRVVLLSKTLETNQFVRSHYFEKPGAVIPPALLSDRLGGMDPPPTARRRA